MAEKDPANGDGQDPTPATPTGGDSKPEGTFTQADLDRLAAKERKRGQDKGVKDLMETLGLDDVDSLKTTISEAAKLREDQLSEQEKLQNALEKAKAETEKAKAEAQKASQAATLKLMQAAVIREAAKADYNLHEDAISDVWTFIAQDAIEITDDGKFKGIDKAVKAVIDKRPFMVNGQKQQPPGSPRQRGKVTKSSEGLKKGKRGPAIRF